MVSEKLLHFVWKYSLYDVKHLCTLSGEPIEVINPGIHNTNEGPDFFNARIKIGQTIWAGNIEIHRKTSDWLAHKHHLHNQYSTIVLHLVYENDCSLEQINSKGIPTALLNFNQHIIENYEYLQKNELWIPCAGKEMLSNTIKLEFWLNQLAIERLEHKTSEINSKLINSKSSWEEAFYITLARSFGFGLNAEPFEKLAMSIPLNYIAKHKNNQLQIEALFFGQAGFLADDFPLDEYFNLLKREYLFLQSKFTLLPMDKNYWKFLRLRPVNFPTIRIAQFANLIHKSSSMFSKIIEAASIEQIRVLLQAEVSEYWHTHYVIGKTSRKSAKHIGTDAINTLLVNTIIPFLFVYGKSKDNEDIINRALQFLERIPPERNSIITKWKEHHLVAKNAFESQALLQLKNEYCTHKRCLDCHIGSHIIRS